MEVKKLSCRGIATGQEFSNLGRWSWMLLSGNKNERTRILATYCPTASASAGGAYRQHLEAFAIMKI